jgi:uncharacterized membrane protein YphA (DoxX/SURF4 family)
VYIFIWILHILVALFFIIAGANKTFNFEKAKESLPWTKEYPKSFVLFIGIAELLGAIGLILPIAIDVLPIFTPLAAIGLAVIMLLATLFHIRRKEIKVIPLNIILLVISLLIAFFQF